MAFDPSVMSSPPMRNLMAAARTNPKLQTYLSDQSLMQKAMMLAQVMQSGDKGMIKCS
jgi:hypothetical protein